MQERLYFSDLDHTLLRSDLSLGEFTINSWNQAASCHKMSIATARSLSKAQELISPLKINMPMVLLDGAMIASAKGEILKTNTLSPTIAKSIYSIGQKLSIEPFVIGFDEKNSERFLYPSKQNSHQTEVLKNYQNDPRLELNSNRLPLKENLKLVYFGPHGLLAQLQKSINEVHKGDIESKLSPEKYGGGWFLTLLHPDADKAKAISWILKQENLPKEDLYLFGDSINDMGMFRLGRGIAVGNALDELKSLAFIRLTKTNDQEAVAHYLQSKLP